MTTSNAARIAASRIRRFHETPTTLVTEAMITGLVGERGNRALFASGREYAAVRAAADLLIEQLGVEYVGDLIGSRLGR